MLNFNYNFFIYINVMIIYIEKMFILKIWRVVVFWGYMYIDLCLNNSIDVVVWNLNLFVLFSYF